MDTLQIIKLFEKNKYVKKNFCGIFSVDKLPMTKLRRPCALIINTDESSGTGEHWLAVFLPRTGSIEYFDSYGNPPQDQRILIFLQLNSKSFIHNQNQIQSNQSTKCGLFSMGYIYFRSKGYSMKIYLKFFTKDKEYNDKFIYSLFKKL